MLAPIAFAWIVGLLVSSVLPPTAQLFAATFALGTSSLLALGADELRSHLWCAPLAALALLAGLAVPPAQRPPLLVRGRVVVDAVVEAETARPDRRDVVVRVRGTASPSGVRVPVGTRLRVLDARPRVGAEVHIVGELVPSLPARNMSPHPAWPDAHVTAGVLAATDDRRVVTRRIGAFDDGLAYARERTRHALVSTLSPRVAGVAAALVLGDGAMLEAGDAEDIRAAGLSHVLAVSGTHIAIAGGAFVMAVDRLLRRSRRVLWPHRIAALSGIPFALLHALFAGAVPSGMRAAVTSSIAWALVAMGRRPDALETTALATLVLGLAAPLDATRPGFLLSVVATVAVLTAPKPRDASLVESLRVAAALVLRCSVATAPLVLYVFGDVPLASLLANLVLVPLGSVALLPISLLHAALALASPDAATVTAALFEPSARAFLAGSSAFAAMDDGLLLPPPTVVQGLAMALAAALVLVRRNRASMRAIAILALVYAADELRLRHAHRLRPRLELTTLDIGQGDAHLLRLPDGRTLLVDAGPLHPDAGARVLVPYLRALRIARIDVAVLTHRHPDHYGGLASVARAIPITELWEPGEAAPPAHEREGSAASVLAAIARRGTRIRTAPSLCRSPLRAAGASIEVLSPCPVRLEESSENDASLVLRIRYGRRTLLLVGDAERDAEAGMLTRSMARLGADVLKVGHHGSRTSSTPAFLAAVRPRYALISAGPGNRFGHPHEETLRSLRAAGARILRTDAMGALRVVTDGRWLEVETAER